MTYTVLLTVEISADSKIEAHDWIVHALKASRKAEIVLLDSDVIAEREDDA